MSGLNETPGPRTDETTPRALVDLAASVRDAGPSAAVSQALDAAWADLHGTTPTAHAAPAPIAWWAWAAGGAVAASVALALWVAQPDRRSEPGRSDPAEGPSASASAETAKPGTGVTAPAGGEQDESSGPDDSHPLQMVAVPEGPFAPPPSRPGTTRPARPGAERPRDEATGRLAALGATSPALEGESAEAPAEAEPFVWLRGADQIEPGMGVQLVRVQVPRLRWDAGMPQRVLVEADLLMGMDGQPRAVRMVRTSGQ